MNASSPVDVPIQAFTLSTNRNAPRHVMQAQQVQMNMHGAVPCTHMRSVRQSQCKHEQSKLALVDSVASLVSRS